MKFTTAIIILLSLTLPPIALANTTILREANQFFSQAVDTDNPKEAAILLDKALLRYEQLYRDQPAGRLAYNIGNTYYQQGNKAMALVFYKRAIKDIPGDENLLHNMQVVREELHLDNSHDQPTHPWLPAFVHLKLWHIISLYILFWLTATIHYIRKNIMPFGVPATVLLLCLATSTILGMEILHPKTPEGIITAPDTMARQGNGRSFEPSFKEPLPLGLEFKILEKRGYWLRIQINSGEECWIPARSCEIV